MDTLKIIALAFVVVIVINRFYRAYQEYKAHKKPANIKPKNRLMESIGEYNKIQIGDLYSMELSEKMAATNELNDEARLQFQDEERDIYIIGIDETSEEFKAVHREYETYDESNSLIENYKKIQLQSFTEDMKVSQKNEIVESIGNENSLLVDFQAKVEGILFPIYYAILFVEAEDSLFMFISWTTANKRVQNEEEIKKMLKSFNYINSNVNNPIQTK